jgi:hypothetical protein
MKFTTSIFAIFALYGADAFMVSTPKTGMQPLQSTPSYQPAQPAYSTAAPGQVAPPVNAGPGGSVARSPSNAPFMAKYNAPKTTSEIFQDITPVKVQGGSLRTCSFDETVSRFTVFLKTTGRPLNANVELWQGPDNAPQKMSVYLEDGSKRPFRATVESPGSDNSISIRNTGQMEFPLTAGLEVDMDSESIGPSEILLGNSDSRIVQGGAVYTTPFPPAVQSVQVALKSDGRPLNARVELLQGPNNNKQVMEIYTEDGRERPFFVIIDTPGSGNVVRIVNTATVEFPLNAAIEPYLVDETIVEESSTGGLVWS